MAEGTTKRDRIDGWKSIADYLNRDVTTVIRWAKFHRLPVNRVPSGSPRRAVFALKSEIDAWVASDASSIPPVSKNVRGLTAEPKASASDSSPPPGQRASPAEDALDSAARAARTKILRWRKPGLYGAAAAVVTLLVWAVWRYTEGPLLSLHAARTTQLQHSKQEPVGLGPIIFRGTFECVACSAENSYLASGMADQLASDLIRIPGVHVLTLDAERNNSAGEPIKLLLTASVAPKESSRIAVSIFLASSDTHEQVWFKHYEALATGLPALEFEIANDIFLYLKPYLPTRDTTPFKAVWTRDPVSYDLYLRGRNHLLYPGPKTTPAAIQEFSEAVRRDPLFAAAYGGLAHAYYLATFDAGISVLKAMPLVNANARREIELDEFAPEGRAYLASEEFTYEYKWQSAEREFQRAISLNPDNPLPHLLYVPLLIGEGRWEEAARQAQIGKSLEPSGLKADFGLAIAGLAKWGATRNPDDLAAAESTCRNAIQRHPDDIRVRDVLVWLLWYSHRYVAAAEENLSMAEVMQDATAISFQRSARSILTAKGAAGYALEQAHYCEARAGADYTCALEDAAAWYTLGGDTENAIRLLNKSVNVRDFSAVEISYELAFVALRGDPRFQQLMAEIHPGTD
jgi:tetratricopeptide (TPR) repeat protein